MSNCQARKFGTLIIGVLQRYVATGYETTEPEASQFEPIRMLEVEIGQTLPAVVATDPKTGRTYDKAWTLVRLHTQPLGLIDVQLEASGLTAAGYADQIWQALAPEIVAHLRQDGLPEVGSLTVAGLPGASTPPCLQARAAEVVTQTFAAVASSIDPCR